MNNSYLRGLKDSIAKLFELQKIVSEKGSIPYIFTTEDGDEQTSLNHQKVKQMLNITLKTMDNYIKRFNKIAGKAAKVKRPSGTNKATFTAVGMTDSLIQTIRSKLGAGNEGNGMSELLQMMSSPVWSQIATGSPVTDPKTTRVLLISFIHLMFAIYGQKPKEASPDILMSGQTFAASVPALRQLEQDAQRKRDEFVSSLRTGSFPKSSDGKAIKDTYETYKSFLNAVKSNHANLSKSANPSDVQMAQAIAPLVNNFANAKKTKTMREFIDNLVNGGFAAYQNDVLNDTLSKIRYTFHMTDTNVQFANNFVQGLISRYTEQLPEAEKKSFYNPDSTQLMLTGPGLQNRQDRQVLTQVRDITKALRELHKVRTGNNNFTDSNKRKLSVSEYNMYVASIPAQAIMTLYEQAGNNYNEDNVKAVGERTVATIKQQTEAAKRDAAIRSQSRPPMQSGQPIA